MASVKKRKNTYQLVAYLGYDSTGRQIRKTKTYKPAPNLKPKQAEKEALRLAEEFERKCKGVSNLNENMRLSELTEIYLNDYAKTELKPITAYNYEGIINNHINPKLGNLKLENIVPIIIKDFLNNLEVQPATRKKIYIVLQSIFTYAVNMRIIPETPCKNIKLPKKQYDATERAHFLNPKQARRLICMLNESGYSEFAVAIKVMLYTGVRPSECLGLSWDDIDFENEVIHIRHNLTDVGGKHWLDKPKTDHSVRTIYLSKALKEELLYHKEMQKKKIAAIGENNYPCIDMVFTSQTGNYKDRKQLLNEFKRFIENEDFSFCTLHMLRHTNATLLLEEGNNLKLISELLGHSSINTTADTYAGIIEETKKKASNVIELKLA